MTTIAPTSTPAPTSRRWRHPEVPDPQVTASPPGDTTPSGRLVVVGYSGSPASLAALRWAGGQGLGPDDRLLVVHATGAPVSVRNGPSVSVADRLGRPLWATVRHTVDEVVGRERADTIVQHGSMVDVLSEHGAAADLVVVGAGRRRQFRRLVAALDCVVLAISERDARPAA